MSKFKVNFGDVPDSYIPPGNYEATITQVVLKESQSSEYPYLNWTFELTDPEHLLMPVWMITSLSPKALFGLKDAFAVLGVTDDSEEFELEVDDDTGFLIDPDVIGIPVTIKTSVNEYQGRKLTRVDKIVECHRSLEAQPPLL